MFYLISKGFHHFEIICFIKISEFCKFVFVLYCPVLSNCDLYFSLRRPTSFLMNLKLSCWISVLSDAILTLSLSFVFQNGQEICDLISFCCCCLILLFVLTRFLNICISQQYNVQLFTPRSNLLRRLSFLSYINLKKILEFLFFFYVPHLVDNHAKIVDKRFRNLMCSCTFECRLVSHFEVKTIASGLETLIF